MEISELEGKKIAILGFGLEGQSTLKFLLKNGVSTENITLLDQNEISCDADVKIVSGEHYMNNMGGFDVIFNTPGISPYHPKISRYKDKLTSQTKLFLQNYTGKVIGVTATKGKSTTVTILHETLKTAGVDVKLVGNIGKPVLDEIDLENTHEYVIYELSSFMLEGFKPKLELGLLGNIFKCHLDWHNDDFAVYKQAKCNILEASKHRITNIELVSQLKIPHLRYFGKDGDYTYKNGIFSIHGREVFNDKDILLKGEHNRLNIASIMAIGDTIDVDTDTFIDALKKVISTFTGLPHRLQEVGTHNGITFVDDSISTTPESTQAALSTYQGKVGTLFLGGHDYGFEFEKFGEFIAKQKIANIVFFPDTGEAIKTAIDATGHTYNSIKTDSMETAIKFAYENSKDGEIALLSCASPSFTMYKNYKQRGDDFKNLAEKLK